MHIFERIAAFLAPHDCLGCSVEGALLCRSCSDGLPAMPSQCYRCRCPIQDFQTCSDCLALTPIRRVIVAKVYDTIAKDLIWRLKFAGGRAAAGIMARQMTTLPLLYTDAVIVPAPTATSRARQRGYDQAKLLAKEISRQTRLPYLDLLARSGQAHQVGADRQQRQRQLAEAYRLSRRLPQTQVILVDDVVTTGATLEAAAQTLAAAGATHIEAIVFAQPLTHKIKPPNIK